MTSAVVNRAPRTTGDSVETDGSYASRSERIDAIRPTDPRSRVSSRGSRDGSGQPEGRPRIAPVGRGGIAANLRKVTVHRPMATAVKVGVGPKSDSSDGSGRLFAPGLG